MAVRGVERDAVPRRLRQDVAAFRRRPAVQGTEAERVGAGRRHGKGIHAVLEVRAEAGVRPPNHVRDAVFHEIRLQRVAAVHKPTVAVRVVPARGRPERESVDAR